MDDDWKSNWRFGDEARELSRKLSFHWCEDGPKGEPYKPKGRSLSEYDQRSLSEYEQRDDVVLDCKAVLYASPEMIRKAGVWGAGISAEARGQKPLYEHLINLGALRDGPDVFVVTHMRDQRRRRSGCDWFRHEWLGAFRTVSESWSDNKLDMRETMDHETNIGLREFFRDGQPDPARPSEHFIPLDKFGVAIEMRPEPKPDMWMPPLLPRPGAG